jgi:hypothetical protein
MNFQNYSHFVPAISYHSENHFRTITISYHMPIDTLLPFRTICRSTHYDHFVPYADRNIIWPFCTICRLTHMTISNHIKKYIMTISYHMQIDTLWPFRTISRSTHSDHFVPYADRYVITISYHMQIDTLWPFRTICR